MCPETINLLVIAKRVYDGAPAHLSRAVLVVHNSIRHDQWIRSAGPTAWPPHSPDWNPLDFYLWEPLRTLVYTAPADNEGALHRVLDAC
jgi:hypothetical protein